MSWMEQDWEWNRYSREKSFRKACICEGWQDQSGKDDLRK